MATETQHHHHRISHTGAHVQTASSSTSTSGNSSAVACHTQSESDSATTLLRVKRSRTEAALDVVQVPLPQTVKRARPSFRGLSISSSLSSSVTANPTVTALAASHENAATLPSHSTRPALRFRRVREDSAIFKTRSANNANGNSFDSRKIHALKEHLRMQLLHVQNEQKKENNCPKRNALRILDIDRAALKLASMPASVDVEQQQQQQNAQNHIPKENEDEHAYVYDFFAPDDGTEASACAENSSQQNENLVRELSAVNSASESENVTNAPNAATSTSPPSHAPACLQNSNNAAAEVVADVDPSLLPDDVFGLILAAHEARALVQEYHQGQADRTEDDVDDVFGTDSDARSVDYPSTPPSSTASHSSVASDDDVHGDEQMMMSRNSFLYGNVHHEQDSDDGTGRMRFGIGNALSTERDRRRSAYSFYAQDDHDEYE